MRHTFIGLLTAATLLSGNARATEPATATRERATRYQREVRAALSGRGWRITQDEAGKLTAEHLYIPSTGTDAFLLGGDNNYARLQIDFRTDGKNHPAASARASLCVYDPLGSSRVGFMAYPPLALRDPKLTQEYLEVLAEAESHLGAGHHADTAAGSGGVRETDGFIKVAVK